jgi:hypothetical protein
MLKRIEPKYRVEFDPDKYKDFIGHSVQSKIISTISRSITEQKDEIIKQRLIAFGILKSGATRTELENAARKCTLEKYPECEKLYYSNGTARVRIIYIDTRVHLDMGWFADTKTNKYTVTGFRYL